MIVSLFSEEQNIFQKNILPSIFAGTGMPHVTLSVSRADKILELKVFQAVSICAVILHVLRIKPVEWKITDGKVLEEHLNSQLSHLQLNNICIMI